jgi:hypothetical protein
MKALPSSDLPDLVKLLTSAGASGPDSLLLIDDARAADSHGAQVPDPLPVGRRIVVVVRLESAGTIARLLQFAALPFRLNRIVRNLDRHGIASVERFAVTPHVGQPVLIFSLRKAAADYAQANLLPAQTGIGGILRRLLARWAGCDLSIGAVLLVGTAP